MPSALTGGGYAFKTIMLLLTSLLFAAFLQQPVHDPTYADSIRGTLITTVTTRGNFVSFNKNHTDRLFLRDASDQMTMNLIMTEPETDLFLADHAKDDLKITYQVREVPKSGGGIERLNYATMLRSLRTGDDVRDWPKKLAADSDLLTQDREQLRQLLAE